LVKIKIRKSYGSVCINDCPRTEIIQNRFEAVALPPLLRKGHTHHLKAALLPRPGWGIFEEELAAK
jgi:hypothetical protein